LIKDLGIRHLIPGLAKKEGAGRTKK
jgi:hypothetical protein